MEILYKLILSLDDKQLDDLKQLLLSEEMRRIDLKIRASNFPILTAAEIILVRQNKIAAMQAYRLRNNCTLLFAKRVIDNWID